MPALDNLRRETYAQARARGATGRAAALGAGFDPSNAAHLDRRPEVIARIAEIRRDRKLGREQSRACIVAEVPMYSEFKDMAQSWVIQQLMLVAAEARADGNYKEASNSLDLISKAIQARSQSNSRPTYLDANANAIGDAALERIEKLNLSLAALETPLRDLVEA